MRIRSIKPEFWRSDDITELDPLDRLLFIGLWSYVDDNGVGRDDLAHILGDLFSRDWLRDPQETVARVSGGLRRLQEAGLIDRYEVDGRSFLHVTTWSSHQRVEKPGKARYPLPDPRQHADREDPAAPSGKSPEVPPPGEGEKGNRGEGEQGAEEKNTTRAARSNTAVLPDRFDEFWRCYPRRVDKPAAIRAWNRAIRTTDPELIITGARRHAADPNRVDQFTKYPGPWLNAEAWNNPPLPARNGGQRESSLDRRDRQVHQMFADLAALEQGDQTQGAIER